MTYINALALHKHFKSIGRDIPAAQLEKRYPALLEKPVPEAPISKKVPEVKEPNGSDASPRRKK